MISCNNLPNVSAIERASSFAVLSVDVNSLDDHDKFVIGGVQEEELDRYEDEEEQSEDTVRSEDYIPDWVVKKVTEVQTEETNPIYSQTYSFNS
jgi:hypothetical protein